jgi:UDP-3-O-acyl-N-acetylglucosamine deacetylase
VLVFDENGPVENELRFRDECVRHKALDLLGDLALAGCDLVGQFIAHRSGHRLNAELVKALLIEEEIVEGRRRSA